MSTIPYFPIFISLQGKKILLYGAGAVGQRRLAALLPFSPEITVISRQIPEELHQKYRQEPKIFLQEKAYTPGEITGYDFVLAATGNPDVNHSIYLECRKKTIPVNNASCREECDFFFPALVQKEDITIGLCSGGQNHGRVRDMAASLR